MAKYALAGKRVLLVGATGGLGSAFAQALADEGARLLLCARHPASLESLQAALLTRVPGSVAGVAACDLTDPSSVEALVNRAQLAFGAGEHTSDVVDVVINATGYDVRKALGAHTLEEVDRSLALNLRGAILLTRALLPHTHTDGAIVHLGGFADGRLAFPFYSVDAATRAGLRAFCESVNRETAGRRARLVYFSPSPADTAAERPYHAIWQAMGTKIEPPERVAAALMSALENRQRVAVMGGTSVSFFAELNAVAPALADCLLLNRYRAILAKYLT